MVWAHKGSTVAAKFLDDTGAAVAANIPVVGILSSQNAEALMSAGCALCVKDFAAPELFDAFGAAVPE